MTIIGKTSDGKLVIQGVFSLFDEKGIPLDIIFDYLNEKGWMPDWGNFKRDYWYNLLLELINEK